MASALNTLHVDLRPDWRGGQCQAWLLLRGLAARGHRVSLLTLRGSPLAKRAQHARIPVEEVSPSFARLRASGHLRGLVRRERFDVVHAHEAHAHTALWLARIPQPGARIVSRRVAYLPADNWLSGRKYRSGLDHYIAVSDHVRQCLAKKGLVNVSVVHDGVELPAVPSPASRKDARTRLGIPPDGIVLSCLSVLEPGKGQAAVIEALPAIRQSLPATLLLGGEGSLRRHLEQRVRALAVDSAVRFLGYVENLEEFFAATDIFIFLAENEGLGSSLLHAMAHELPVIALDDTAASEVIRDAESGRLIHSTRPEAVAGAVLYLARHPELARELAAHARTTIAQRFTADHMVEETLKVYRSVRHSQDSAL